MSDPLSPPRAPHDPTTRSFHGDHVTDEFGWMADKSDPRLLDYLEAENKYTEALTRDQAPLREQIYAEIAGRTQQTDLSVPLLVTHTDGTAFWYYSRTVEGLDYPLHCRVPASDERTIPTVSAGAEGEQVLLDVNEVARDHDFCALGVAEMSPDGRLLAYSVDTAGDERYDLWVRDVASGEPIDGPVADVGPGGAWLGPRHLLYVRVDESWRPYQVWRHELGTEVDADALVFTEDDERFFLGVDESRDHAFALIELGSKNTSETHLIPADDPTAAPRCVTPRREGLDYSVEVAPDGLFIVHNLEHPQFALSRAPLGCASVDDWEPLVPGTDSRRITGVAAYRRALVVSHRTDGLTGVAVMPRDDGGVVGAWSEIGFDEPLYDVDADSAPDYDTDVIRLSYESMVTPPSVLQYHFDTGERVVLKETPVLPLPEQGPYRRGDYVQERLWAVAPDGVRIPLSVVRRSDTPVDGTAPCLLYGYGSYEIAMGPFFSIGRLSLLDRGFVYAVAHVRGGGELGRPWYEGGRLGNKRNTFDDFVACGRRLVEAGYSAPDRLLAEGGSAGGLLMGVIANEASDLFRGIHAAVPFVDALTTILNPDLPLTVTEWEEWGDPLHDPEAYAYIKGYSPYENVRVGDYPALLVTTGLNDTRVEVTEPAKWVARLRERATVDPARPILLRTELSSGHGGVSGRYQAWRDRAFELAWLIDLVS